MENINLLTVQKVQKKNGSQIFTFTLICMLLVILASSAIVLYSLSLRIKISNLSSEQSKILNQMQQYSELKTKQQLVKERLHFIQQIIPKSSEPLERVSLIVNEIPASASVESIKLNDDILEIKIVSRNLAELNKYMDNIKKTPSIKGSNVKKVFIEGFNFSGTSGRYSVLAKLTFNSSSNNEK